jgi:hypothetical protein
MRVNKQFISKLVGRGLNALAATMLISACIHLSIAVISFFITQRIEYVNPIDFLGFSLVWPQYLHSEMAAGIAWLFLIVAFFIIFCVHEKLQISVSVTRRERAPAKVKRQQKQPSYARYYDEQVRHSDYVSPRYRALIHSVVSRPRL